MTLAIRFLIVGFCSLSFVCLGCFGSTSNQTWGQDFLWEPDIRVEATNLPAPQSESDVISPSSDKNDNPTADLFDWPCWLGPDGNGHSRETGLLTTFPNDKPTILWRTELGTGYSGISVADGRAITMFGRDGRETIACYEADSGESLWTVDSDIDFAEGRSPGPRSTPIIDEERVYVLGASGNLHCLEAATGKSLWQYNLIKKFNFRLHEEGLSPTPLIHDGQLIVAAGKSIFALNKLTGELVWRALDETINHSTPTIHPIGGQRQLIVLTGSNLVGLSLADGEELWRHPQSAVNIATPVVGPEDQIFLGAAYGFGCQLVQVKGGQVNSVYKNNSLAPHTATPILHEGHLYGFHDRPGLFKCIDFATGEEKWTTRETSKGNLIIADGQIILINEEGQLILAPVSPEGFEPTARARLFRDALCYTMPTLANGRLYVRSNKELVCLQLTEK